MPQPPAVAVERLSEGHQPRRLPARLDKAPVLGGAIPGLAARVLAGHASSAAIMQGSEPGADTDPAVWSRARLMPPALPFAIIAAIGVSRIAAGPGWGLLPLLAVGPAVAAAAGGPLSTLAAGAGALAICVLFAAGMQPGATHRMAGVAFLAVAGVTAAGVLASRARGRRDRELAQARLIAEAAQKVVLRPVPRQAGPVRLAARYLSACSGARVGGDLYEVATTPDGVRLIVGDAKGKGLPAVQPAAAVLGVFREAAHEEDSLAAIVSRIETSLARQLSDEQFVTAILAEVSPDGTKIELLSCGHPAPLLLGPAPPRFVGLDDGSLPLGLGHLADVPRIPVTIAFEPGDALLFYTDGASEARNWAGAFFPLADCAAVRAPPDPATLPGRLGDEVIRHAGHAPDDDMALLVIYRDGALTVRRRRRDSRQRPDSGPRPVAALTTMLDQVIAWSRRSPRCGRRPRRSEPVAGSAGPLA